MTDKTELSVLKERANQMSIPFSPNIGLAALKAKVNAALNDEPIPEDEVPAKRQPVKNMYPDTVTESPNAAPETVIQMKNRLRKEANRLVRVNVMNRNPAMKDYTGDWYCVGNGIVGDVRKFVQYDTQDGFHVPYIIYLHLCEKEYQVFVETTDKKGRPLITCKNVKELSVELLDPLTNDELQDLANRQIINKSIE